jgi:hypothetical protein
MIIRPEEAPSFHAWLTTSSAGRLQQKMISMSRSGTVSSQSM